MKTVRFVRGVNILKKKTRVLHVVSGLNAGGIESLLYSYYTTFEKNKIVFDFIIFGENIGLYGKKFIESGSKIYKVPLLKDVGFIRLLKELYRVLKLNKDYEIIHIHRNEKSGVILFFAFLLGFKVRIVHSHNYIKNETFLFKMRKKLLTLPIKLFATDKFACGIKASKWLYGEKAYSKNNTVIINNAIDANRYSYNGEIREAIREKLGLSDKFIVGNVGRLSYQKNQVFLVDIFNEIYKLNKNAFLVLIGDFEDIKIYNEVIEKINRFGLNDVVKLLGPCSDISDLMQAMDVFVFPSNFEGLGIVAIEAQAVGLKTYASFEVPEDAAITNLFKYISLNVDPTEWAEIIINDSRNYVRENTYHQIKKAGYDIKNSAVFLERYYCSKLDRG